MPGSSPNDLLIAGVPKAATTSLFRYLGDHPQICPAHVKETYYFAPEFDRKNRASFSRDSSTWNAFFKHRSGGEAWRLEGTPYTLYARGAARSIRDLLPQARILIILRNPVERLYSNYRMQKFRLESGLRDKSFQDYVAGLSRRAGPIPNNLEIGCYNKYLDRFFDCFAKDRIQILFFEEFVAEPSPALQKLCGNLGLDEHYYRSYPFQVHNSRLMAASPAARRAYLNLEKIAADCRTLVAGHARLFRLLEFAARRGKPLLEKWIRARSGPKTSQKDSIPAQTRAWLADYYQPHNQALSESLGRPVPWPSP